MSKYKHLLSPGRIGTLEIRNRLLQTAMGSNLAEEGGFVGDALVAYHEARAAGGIGLIITEAIAVGHPQGTVLVNQVGISDDKFIPGLKRMTDAAHRHGAKMAAQLHFGGIMAAKDMVDGRDVWVPSMPQPSSGIGMHGTLFPEEVAMTHQAKITQAPNFRVLDQADIDQLIEWFASGAERAVSAGFDAVEIHGGHGYIIAGFLSPASNQRNDDYGGSAENRVRLLRQVTEAIRERVGPDFPVWCKIDSAEFFVENGVAIEDVCYYAQVAEQAGADAITVTANHDYSIPRALFSSYLPHEPGKLIPYAAQVKAAVSIPITTVGRIDPDVADKAIADGKFDFMAMGRKQLSDPNYAKSLAEGGVEKVRPCIYCYTCLSQAMVTQPLRCSVNGDLGFEKDDLLAATSDPKRVVVVGGGPGGMEAARRLTVRGHRVTLLEGSDQLGGTARIAAIAYAPNGDFVDWLKRELALLQVDVRLGTMATVESLRALDPDAVVVATGAIRRAPDIEGRELAHVHDGQSLHALLLGEEERGAKGKASLGQRAMMGAARTLGMTDSPEMVRKASKLWMPLGDKVVIIGGELVGMELAEFLNERGREVTLIGDEPQFGRGLSPARRAVMLDEMPLDGIAIHQGAGDIAIREKAVHFTTNDGEAMQVAADNVIIAQGAEANTGLYDELVGAGIEAHMVGDCQGVGYIIGAVRNAADVAAKI
ncbi:MAG: FAD-dependent oxidoreductase [Novosphingobium sp.]|nr:FAD-dependent oxidoreductase [Novosphingobium sp.]MCP5403411.1 FAD-dependent oxidoreductase [Novosphingobium sp.]